MMKPVQFLSIAGAVLVLCIVCSGIVQSSYPAEQYARIQPSQLPINIGQYVGTPHLPPIIGQNCGTLFTGDDLNSYGDANAEGCLWRTYRHCQAATLIYIIHGTDIGVQYQITVQPSESGDLLANSEQKLTCTISNIAQGYALNFDQPVEAFPCNGLRQQDGGLLVSGYGKAGDLFIAPFA